MTEREHLPGLSEREILEGMGAEALVKHIMMLGQRASHIENKMNEAANVLEGTYGLTVEEYLESQEADGETKK